MQIAARFIVLAVTLLCCLAIFHSVRWGMADMYAREGYEIMDSWRQDRPVSSDQWREAHRLVAQANELDSSHPVYLQRLGRLHYLRITEALVPDEQFEQEATLSISYFEQSLEIRPRWGQAWGELAFVRQLAGEMGKPFLRALHNAVAAGPWEPAVLRIVSQLGLHYYDQLSLADRELVRNTLIRGLRSPSRGVYDFTFELIAENAALKSQITAGLYPHLAERWRPSVRYNFFRLADWAWDELPEAQQSTVVEQAVVVLRQIRPNYTWIRNAQNKKFKVALCERSQRISPDDTNLKSWCRAG